MNIKVDTRDVTKKLGKLKGQSETALKKVVNEFKKRGPGWISKDVVARYNAKQKDIKSTMSAKGEGLDAEIDLKGRVMSVAHFGLKPRTAPTKRKAYQTTAEILKGGRKGFDTVTTFVYNGTAFTRRDKSGVVHGRSMWAIKTLSTPQMAGNQEVAENIREDINKNLMKRAQHYLEYYLNK